MIFLLFFSPLLLGFMFDLNNLQSEKKKLFFSYSIKVRYKQSAARG